jgi:SAM-dependent methyltransferase
MPRVEKDPKKRFSNRVAYYAKYRPHYPETVLNLMEQELGFSSMSVIADVGSGTGILSEMFLKHGNLVYCVEPNKEMREKAETILAGYARFRSINGAAEATTLPPASVDFIAAAQSFHWFDRPKTRAEFLRILKPNGWVILIWNTRKNSTAFMQEYERLVRGYAKEPRLVRHEDITEEDLRRFLGNYEARTFSNRQALDFDGLKGRLLSSSYAPLPDDPKYDGMLNELRRIFDSYQEGRLVHLEYVTEVYFGQLAN